MMRENAFSSTVVVVGFGPISGAAIVTQGRGEGSGKQRSKFRKRQNLADEFIEDLGNNPSDSNSALRALPLEQSSHP